MKSSYILYGWKVSYYTAKARCYMKFKGVPFEEKQQTLLEMKYTLYNATNEVVMPVLRTPDGVYIQDTKLIIETLESKHPLPPALPPVTCPTKRFVSLLLEAWADEFWVPFAMHYRWNYPESVKFFQKEAGDNMLPWMPRIVKDFAAEEACRPLRGFLPAVGAVPEQYDMMHRWTTNTLRLLDLHFQKQQYLLGGDQPSVGDFGLAGPLVAHLARDPWPRDNLMTNCPNIRKWIDRMESGGKHNDVTVIEGDSKAHLKSSNAIPDTLVPVLRIVLSEFVSILEGTAKQVEELKAIQKFADGKPLPRSLGKVSCVFECEKDEEECDNGKNPFTKSALPFALWKIQGVLDDFHALDAVQQQAVKDNLRSYSLELDPLLQLKFSPLERVGLRVRFC